MTLYVAIIGLGTLAGILFNIIMNKRVIYKVIGIVITLATGTFACCVVLFPYNFFDSYTNLIIKLSLSAVLLVVIYISARMIVNAVSTIKGGKDTKADKDKLKAEPVAEEISVASFALKNRVKDIITADKTVRSPAQKVSVNLENYSPKYAAVKATKEETHSAQSAAKQTFGQALKDADEKILSQSKSLTESVGAAVKTGADKPADAELVSAAALKPDDAKPAPGATYEQPEQKVGADVKAGAETRASEPVLEEPAGSDVSETKPEAQGAEALDALINKFVKDKPADAELVSAAVLKPDDAKRALGAMYEQPEQKAGADVKAGAETKVSEPALEKPAKSDVSETKPEAQGAKAVDVLIDKFVKDKAAGSQGLAEYETEAKAEEQAAVAGQAEAKPEEAAAEVKAEEAAAEAKAEEQIVLAGQAEVKAEDAAAEAKAEEQAAVVGQAEAKPEEAVAEAKADETAAVIEQTEAKLEEAAAEAKTEEQAVVAGQTEAKPEEAAAEAKAEEAAAEVKTEETAAVIEQTEAKPEEQAVVAGQAVSAAAPDRYAAIIIKARELIKEGKYVYAAGLLQMCSDRSEDEQQRKQADILIIECLALSDKGGEARNKWVEFLNKQYTLGEDDKANLKRVMSSL